MVVTDGVHILFHFNNVLLTKRDALYQGRYLLRYRLKLRFVCVYRNISVCNHLSVWNSS